MSRSGYIDLEPWQMIKWRGQVASAIRGKRGQALLRDLLAALDAMPEKRLIQDELEDDNGEVCALGAVGKRRGVELTTLDPEDSDAVAVAFDIARPLACEIVYLNDEYYRRETPEARFERIRNWVIAHLAKEAA